MQLESSHNKLLKHRSGAKRRASTGQSKRHNTQVCRKGMLQFKNVVLRQAVSTQLDELYQLVTADEEWTKYNGPYFPYETPTIEEFESGVFKRLVDGIDMLLISIDGKAVGSVSRYWENEATRWLEIGVIIYDSSYWSQGIGKKALVPWITHLFSTLEIERVGLTTWSGNPRMMACALKLGLMQEARLRKVRYFQGKYFDSVKYGVLRSEWEPVN